jgi:DNA repair ATPase RecN
MDKEKREFNVTMEKLEAKLKEWGVDLEKFKARAGRASGEVKVEYEKQIKFLHEKLEHAKKKLEELEKSGSSASEELKKGIEKAWAELKKAFDNVTDKFK